MIWPSHEDGLPTARRRSSCFQFRAQHNARQNRARAVRALSPVPRAAARNGHKFVEETAIDQPSTHGLHWLLARSKRVKRYRPLVTARAAPGPRRGFRGSANPTAHPGASSGYADECRRTSPGIDRSAQRNSVIVGADDQGVMEAAHRLSPSYICAIRRGESDRRVARPNAR